MKKYDILMDALESGEITQKEFDAARHIKFDINEEDVPLFIQGCVDPLQDVESVEYSNMDSEYDGVYEVTMKSGEVNHYGWYDSDTVATLYLIV